MKKITYLLALCLVAQTMSFAQTAVPDSDFESWLITNGYDVVANNMIDDDNAVAITSETGIYLGSSTIADFTGISVFVNLLDFDIEYNATVTSLDVSALTSLTRLDIEGCSSLSTITMPGAGSQLVDFQAADAALTTVVLSNNTLLETVLIQGNQLTSLDLSDQGALTTLNCYNQSSATSLTALDMRNGNNSNVIAFDSGLNNNLTCIFVDDASEFPAGYLMDGGAWSRDLISTYVNDQPECDLLGTEDRTASVFSIYPNPTRNTLNVISKSQTSKMDVYSITGKLILSKSLSFGDNSVNISSLSSGVYLAKFSADNRSETKKLIVN